MLLEQLGQHFDQAGQEGVAKLFLSKAGQIARQALVIHDAVFEQQILSADMRLEKEKKVPKSRLT